MPMPVHGTLLAPVGISGLFLILSQRLILPRFIFYHNLLRG